MQKLFDEVGSLDKRCYEEFGLSEDILMEHAADGMADYIRANFPANSKIIIVCGSGNNGADGIALSRLLHSRYNTSLLLAKKPKSKMAKLQLQRANAIGVESISELEQCDIVVDALLGTGFQGDFDNEIKNLLNTMNMIDAFKIACDIPSGLRQNGETQKSSFIADVTLTMGALKKSMFSDSAKEFVGEIKVLDLGVSREIYEKESEWKLLDLEDLKLPFRDKKSTHKGSFGHATIISGDKLGATALSAEAALCFGAGLVTLLASSKIQTPNSIMQSETMPSNTTAVAIGMGLGDAFKDKELHSFIEGEVPIIADADIFHMELVKKILLKKEVVLTPHPKEFISLLKRTDLADITIDELQNNRFKYVQLFCHHYPNAILLLKGANVIIGKEKKFFINPHGTSALAKGGSGDVLSGLIVALLAQGYEILDATIHASLTHTKLAINYSGANFSLTPEKLIAGIERL